MQHSDPNQQSNFAKIPLAYRLIATGLGSGFSPFASGTAGSAVGILLYLPFAFMNHFILLALTVVVFVIGVVAADKVEKVLGEDPSVVVIDEVVGMWVSLLFLPVTVLSVVLAFVLFRVYDIFKPSPARESEALKNGVGIMVDDVIAGLYANLTVRVILFVLTKI